MSPRPHGAVSRVLLPEGTRAPQTRSATTEGRLNPTILTTDGGHHLPGGPQGATGKDPGQILLGA